MFPSNGLRALITLTALCATVRADAATIFGEVFGTNSVPYTEYLPTSSYHLDYAFDDEAKSKPREFFPATSFQFSTNHYRNPVSDISRSSDITELYPQPELFSTRSPYKISNVLYPTTGAANIYRPTGGIKDYAKLVPSYEHLVVHPTEEGSQEKLKEATDSAENEPPPVQENNAGQSSPNESHENQEEENHAEEGEEGGGERASEEKLAPQELDSYKQQEVSEEEEDADDDNENNTKQNIANYHAPSVSYQPYIHADFKPSPEYQPHKNHFSPVIYLPDYYKTIGGGQSAHADHYHKVGGKGSKGYNSNHHHDSKDVGNHGNKYESGKYGEHGGHKNNYLDEDGHYKKYHKGGKRYKGAKFGEKKGHKKGHKTKGYHNKFFRDEYHKEHKFYDDYHKNGKFDKYGDYHAHHDKQQGAYKKGGKEIGSHYEDKKGKKGSFSNGHHDQEDEGFSKYGGGEKYHKHHEDYGKKGGDTSGKVFGYKEY